MGNAQLTTQQGRGESRREHAECCHESYVFRSDHACVVCSVLCVLNLLDSYFATHIACVALNTSRDRSEVGRSLWVTDKQDSKAFEFQQKGLF